MNAIPSACASRELAGSTGRPSISTTPLSLGRTPPRMFMVVDLPEPFSPTSPSTSPRRSSKLTSRRTCTLKKLLLRPWTFKITSGTSLAPGYQLVTDRIGHRGEQYDAALYGVDR